MASTLKINTLTGVTTAGSIAVTGEGNSTTTNLQQGLCKMWVNFDGSASGAASRDTFNVSGMTDTGTGDYQASYSNAMSNANYTMIATSCFTGADTFVQNAQGQTTSLADIHVTEGGSLRDSSIVSVAVHGDLA